MKSDTICRRVGRLLAVVFVLAPVTRFCSSAQAARDADLTEEDVLWKLRPISEGLLLRLSGDLQWKPDRIFSGCFFVQVQGNGKIWVSRQQRRQLNRAGMSKHLVLRLEWVLVSLEQYIEKLQREGGRADFGSGFEFHVCVTDCPNRVGRQRLAVATVGCDGLLIYPMVQVGVCVNFKVNIATLRWIEQT